MDEKETKLAATVTDYIGAYDERTRLFNELRDANLTHEDREARLSEYVAASRNFDSLRSKLQNAAK